MLVTSSLAYAQHLPKPGNFTPSVALISPALSLPALPCRNMIEPFDVDDYNGPLNRVVARFSQRVESGTVHLPHNHGVQPCSMSAGDKFRLFVEDNVDPANFVGSAWDAGMSQLTGDDPSFGQGSAGYGKRYAATLADNASSDFFGTFLYPAVFRQDPRYYRMAHGSVTSRLDHALVHRFVTRTDSGKPTFNFSEWLGTISSKALSNMYHPDNPRGFGPTASRVGFSVGSDMAWDVLREFWPEVAHKFRLPFRGHDETYFAVAPDSQLSGLR